MAQANTGQWFILEAGSFIIPIPGHPRSHKNHSEIHSECDERSQIRSKKNMHCLSGRTLDRNAGGRRLMSICSSCCHGSLN